MKLLELSSRSLAANLRQPILCSVLYSLLTLILLADSVLISKSFQKMHLVRQYVFQIVIHLDFWAQLWNIYYKAIYKLICSIGNLIVEIKLLHNCLICMLEFSTLIRCHLYIETAPVDSNWEGLLVRPYLATEGKHCCKWVFREHFYTKTSQNQHITSSHPGQNGCHFTDDIFKFIFINGKFCIWIQISVKFFL